MKPVDLLTHTSPILADRVRLAIMATLAAAEEPVEFNALLNELQLTKGNLASHIRKLEQAGLLTVNKEFVDRKPRTSYRCTARGYRDLRSYLEQVEALLKGVTAG
jgi:DNA-binding HxlR family transcriptional regulator